MSKLYVTHHWNPSSSDWMELSGLWLVSREAHGILAPEERTLSEYIFTSYTSDSGY
jgi:hypothetical protein